MIHALASFLILAISPTFWHDILSQTAARTVAVSITVTALIKGIRKFYPSISGPWALLLNLLFSIAGLFAGMAPANVFSETTLIQLIGVIAMAGGFHNIWNTLQELWAPKPIDPPASIPSDGKMKVALGAIALFAILIPLTGCIHGAAATPPPPLPVGAVDATDAHANQVLQTIQAFMGPVVRDVSNGKLAATPAQHTAINTLDRAYNGAAIAEQAYHACVLAGGASAACLTSSALVGALAGAQSAFTATQTALATSAAP